MLANRRLGPLLIAAGAVISLVAASCDSSASPNQPTLTAAQALSRVDDYLHQTIKATTGKTAFDKTLSSTDSTSACVAAGTDSASTGQVEAQVGYETSTVSPEPDLTAIKSFWSNQGFSVTANTNNLVAYTKDNYSLYATYNPDRQKLDVTGNSPCVWPNGVAPTTPS